MRPKVSVIMPSLNVCNYIEECVASVCNQTLTNLEILCIDAGSTDGTLDIIKKFVENDSRVCLIQSEIKSYGYQVNLGIEKATGEYVAIVETDDYISQDMYERLYDEAIKFNADIAKGNYEVYVTLKNGKRKFNTVSQWNSGEFYHHPICAQNRLELFISDIHIWRGIYKSEFLKDNHITLNESKGAAFQDIGFSIQVLSKAKSIVYVEEAFYKYQMFREGSSTASCKGFEYAYNEFKWLYKGNDLNLQGMIKRMLHVFMSEYPRSLAAEGYDINSESIRPYFEWFREVLEANFRRPDISSIATEATIENIKSMLKNDYPMQLVQENQRKEQRRDEINQKISFLSQNEVVIYGAGKIGKKIAEYFDENDVNSLGFVDRSVNGDNIHPLHYWTDFKPNIYYIISSSKYYDEIYQELLENNIDRSHIYDWRELYE